MSALLSDLRQSIRILRSKPGFSIMAVLMLALGIGACTAIFTVVNAVLLRPLPYVEPDKLVQISETSERGGRQNVPEANFKDYEAGSRSFEGMAVYNSGVGPVLVGKEAVRARQSTVGNNFFDVLKVRPLIGTSFPSTQTADATIGVVVSHGFWQRALGGGPLSDKQLTLQNQTCNIIGVMPPDFNFPAGVDIWLPRAIQGPFNPSRSAHNWLVIGRLKPEADARSASAELQGIITNIRAQYRDVTSFGVIAIPLQDQLTQTVRVALPVLLAAVGILLLVACANVTNLLLAHISGRNRELAVRTALGASRSAISRLFLVQSLTITTMGGLIGIALAFFVVDGLLAMSGGNLPRFEEIRPDGWVLSFAVLVSLAVGIALGLLPAFRAGRMDLNETLKQGGRSQTHGMSNRIVRSGLVVLQVAMTIVLLVGASLLGRSFMQVLQVQLGFQTENRVAFEMLDAEAGGPDGRRRLSGQLDQLLQQISSMPGVSTVGGINRMPLSGSASNGRFRIEGGTDSGGYWPNYRIATPGFFETMSIPLIRGRVFDGRDGAASPQVAVISQAVANTVWPGEDPIGRRINYGNMDGDPNFMTIVGVVGDIRTAPETPVRGDVYVHYLQRGFLGNYTLVVNGVGAAPTLAQTVVSRIRSVNPNAAVRVQTLDEMYSATLTNRRFNFALLAAFGGTALVLAVLGVYGVTAYSVAQRRQEIGIRIALGAQRSDVTRMFLGEGSKLVLLGIVIGVAGAVAASRTISSLLFNVETTDVPTYLVAIIPMFAAALLASHLPARRAARVDPMITIQQDRI